VPPTVIVGLTPKADITWAIEATGRIECAAAEREKTARGGGVW